MRRSKRVIGLIAGSVALATLSGLAFLPHSGGGAPAPGSCTLGDSITPVTQRDVSLAASRAFPLRPRQLPVTSAVHPVPSVLRAPSRGKPVITPSRATTVLSTAFAARELASAEDDAPMLARLETGAARAWDVAETNQELDAGFRTAKSVRTIDAQRVFVPFQKTYPACFLGVVQTTPYRKAVAGPSVELFVLWRRSATTQWKIALHAAVTGVPLSTMEYLGNVPPDPAHTGYTRPAPQPTWLAPENAPEELARYWQYWKDHGSAPPQSQFAEGTNTSGEGAYFAQSLQDRDQPGGWRLHETFSSDPTRDGLYEFAVGGGENLTCSAIEGFSTLEPTSSDGVLTQTSAREWGNSIPPGSYRSVTHNSIRETCILLNPTQGIGAMAFGIDGDHTFEAGFPAG